MTALIVLAAVLVGLLCACLTIGLYQLLGRI
jgi:hypothetical protein